MKQYGYNHFDFHPQVDFTALLQTRGCQSKTTWDIDNDTAVAGLRASPGDVAQVVLTGEAAPLRERSPQLGLTSPLYSPAKVGKHLSISPINTGVK